MKYIIIIIAFFALAPIRTNIQIIPDTIEGCVFMCHAENDGSFVYDLSSLNKKGTPSGSILFVDGYLGSGVEGDGSNDTHVDFGNPTGLPSGSESRTFTLWVKPDLVGSEPPHRRMFLLYGGGTWKDCSVSVHATLGVATYQAGSGSGYKYIWGDVNICDDKWHFIAVTYEGPPANLVHLYVDNVEANSDSDMPHDTDLTGGNLSLLGNNDQALYGEGDGAIDYVAIFDRVLSRAEITAIYEHQAKVMQ